MDVLHTDLTAPTPAGTFVIGKVGIDQTTPGTTNAVVGTGNVASGVTDAGNPVKIGGYASTAFPTAVTAGQRANSWLNLNGASMVAPMSATGPADGIATALIGGFLSNTAGAVSYPATAILNFNGGGYDRNRGDTNGLVVQSGLSGSFWNYAAGAAGIVSSVVAVTLKAAGGAGVRTHLRTLTIDNDTLSAVTEVAIRDGAAGTVLWRGKVQTVAGNRAIVFDPPLRGTANTLLEAVVLTSVTGGIYFNASGFTGF